MAINAKDYFQTKEKNIKLHKKSKRLFLFDFRVDGKRYRRFHKIEAINHSPKENLEELRLQLINKKRKIKEGETSYKSTLDELFIRYMENEPLTAWTHKKKHIYDLYIGNSGLINITKKSTKELLIKRAKYDEVKIGTMQIFIIKPMHIEKIISHMEKVHNLSPHTQKSILEILSPLFNFTMKNELMSENLAKEITIKIPSQKKIVTNATELFKKVYVGITEHFKDNPSYQALFLFGLTDHSTMESGLKGLKTIDGILDVEVMSV